ncbi:hypothetical protein [Melittangium boletus]|uniref:hypothetical protein n=1 Tax=Melittangium boletus TaxID=83453 RepID=UPI003DA288F7
MMRYRSPLLLLVGLIAGSLLPTAMDRLIRGESRTVKLTENIIVSKQSGAGDEVRAVLGKGTLAQLRTEGGISFLTVYVSFLEDRPPYVEVPDVAIPHGQVRVERNAW